MHLCAKVKHFLDKHRVTYSVLSHPPTVTLEEAADMLNVMPSKVARSVILGDEKGKIMVVLPLTHKIDFLRLQRLTQRHLRILSRQEVDAMFCDCEAGSHPPFGPVYGLTTIVDSELIRRRSIYFEPGTHSAFVKLNANDFHYLMSQSLWGCVSLPADEMSISEEETDSLDTKAALQATVCPTVCQVGQELLSTYPLPTPAPNLKDWITWRPGQDTQALKGIFPLSSKRLTLLRALLNQPTLSAESASSDSDATTTARNLAILECIIKDFWVSYGCALASKAIWKHALLSAALMRDMIQEQAPALSVEVGMQLALFQNIGFGVLGKLFVPEFMFLSKMLRVNPKTPVAVLEKRIIGMGQAQQLMKCGHAAIGGWLAARYGFPDSLRQLISHHHDQQYEGPLHDYVRLLAFLNASLRREGLGEGDVVLLERDYPNNWAWDPSSWQQWVKSWLAERESVVSKALDGLALEVTDPLRL